MSAAETNNLLIKTRNLRIKSLRNDFKKCIETYDYIICKFLLVRQDDNGEELAYMFTDTLNCEKLRDQNSSMQGIWEQGEASNNWLLTFKSRNFMDLKNKIFENSIFTPIDIAFPPSDAEYPVAIYLMVERPSK